MNLLLDMLLFGFSILDKVPSVSLEFICFDQKYLRQQAFRKFPKVSQPHLSTEVSSCPQLPAAKVGHGRFWFLQVHHLDDVCGE